MPIIETYMGYGFMGVGFLGGYEFTDDEISATPSRGATPLSTTLEYTGYSDEITAYLWEVSDGQTSTDQTPSFSFSDDGSYDVTLTITIDSVQYSVTSYGAIIAIDGYGYLAMFKHLLPRARAWLLTPTKTLRSFFEGLCGIPADLKTFIDNIWLDIFPQYTRDVSGWMNTLGMPDYGYTESENRDRLDVEWALQGGQSPRYIQDTLQAYGFDVYVHEWWSDDTPTARIPTDYLAADNITSEAGKGYPLVNKIIQTTIIDTTACGEDTADCGEDSADCGEYDLTQSNKQYFTSTNSDEYPYYMYIGAEVFGDLAEIDAAKQNELERLCLKICPAHLHIGMLIDYV